MSDLHKEAAAFGPIVLVGPVAPYRSGVSQYNTALFRQLVATGTPGGSCFSFSRQYPGWLYPGESDVDPHMAGHREPDVHYCLDSINPLSWFRTTRRIVRQKPRAVFFHWWTIFFLPCFASMVLALKLKGIPVALICHNLVDHDSKAINVWISRVMLSLADGFVVHSIEHEHAVRAVHPGKPTARYTIPPYESFPFAKGELPKRGRLELLFFGLIRPYKGVDLLIKALEELGDERVFLTVVGEPWSDPDEIIHAAAKAPNIELHLAYSSEEAVAEYFARADMVVLPYRSATGSAVASVAAFYAKPILATRVGGLPEVVSDGETGVLVPPNDVDALRTAIAAMDRDTAASMSDRVRERKVPGDWASSIRTLEALASTLSGDARATSP